jgi:hypothetical protein
VTWLAAAARSLPVLTVLSLPPHVHCAARSASKFNVVKFIDADGIAGDGDGTTDA